MQSGGLSCSETKDGGASGTLLEKPAVFCVLTLICEDSDASGDVRVAVTTVICVGTVVFPRLWLEACAIISFKFAISSSVCSVKTSAAERLDARALTIICWYT